MITDPETTVVVVAEPRNKAIPEPEETEEADAAKKEAPKKEEEK